MTNMSDIYSWGDPQLEFKGTTTSNLLRILFFGALTLSSMAAAVLAVGSPDASGAILVVLGLGAAVFFGRYLWRFIQARRETINIYQEGVTRKTGDDLQMIAWNDMVESSQSIYTFRLNFIPVYKHERYLVRTKDGTEHLFRGAIPDAKKLGGILHTQVARQVLPAMIERYNSGDTVEFGTLKVSKQGLQQGNKSLVWNELKGMNMNNGVLSFKKEGKWLRWGGIQINNTPNFIALLDLLEAITGMKFA